MKLNSLAFRLFATAAAWTLIALPIVGIVIYSLISNLIMSGFDNRLRQHGWELQAEALGSGEEPARPKNLAEPLFGITNSGWYWQIKPYKGAAGRQFVSNSLATGRLPSPHESKAERIEGDMRWMDAKDPLGKPIRVLELVGTIGKAADSPTYLFTVAGPLEWPHSTINNFGLVLSLALALTGLALLAATFLQVACWHWNRRRDDMKGRFYQGHFQKKRPNHKTQTYTKGYAVCAGSGSWQVCCSRAVPAHNRSPYRI